MNVQPLDSETALERVEKHLALSTPGREEVLGLITDAVNQAQTLSENTVRYDLNHPEPRVVIFDQGQALEIRPETKAVRVSSWRADVIKAHLRGALGKIVVAGDGMPSRLRDGGLPTRQEPLGGRG